MVTVKELRKSGNKVRVLHHRKILPDGTVLCKGGKTVVEITTKDGRELSGTARCRDDESYNKRMGVSIALGRAMSSAQEEKKTSCRPHWFRSKGGPCGLARKP